ncbi:DNA methyltransferase [Escherichia coli]|uniref:DNA methyltransferase n=1 Tax=Escherichia coli TaxID=562 RepID=UPI000DF62614|nr:DNA methylase [Escherichia coli]
MSRFVLGNCIDVMARIPDNAIDFILTDPPYLVGFRDRSGRTIAGDVNDDWLQPASNEMYRVLKKRRAVWSAFYGWNRIDRFMAAWKRAGFSVVGTCVHQKLHIQICICRVPSRMRLYPGKKAVRRCLRSHYPTCWAGNFRQSSSPDGKAVTSLQPLIESFTHPNAIVLGPVCRQRLNCVAALQSGRRYIGIELH